LPGSCEICGLIETPGRSGCGGWNRLEAGHDIDDRFTIQGLLGVGAMGSIYRATQRSMKREVAIKVLRCHLADDPVAVQRFEREALAVSRLCSPHTVALLDFGSARDGKLLYLAMELLQGRTLRSELRAVGPLPLARAVSILDQVLTSLEEAHHKGVIHRDIKPDNIFLVDGVGDHAFVKVLDFGIARIADAAPTRDTKLGRTMGSPAYSSVEQILSGVQDHRSDLHAVGAVFYEMLTGRLPFDAPSPVGMAVQKMNMNFVPLREANPAIEHRHGLEDLLRRALSHSPEARPQCASTFRSELSAVLRAEVVQAKPAPLDPIDLSRYTTLRAHPAARLEETPAPLRVSQPIGALSRASGAVTARLPLGAGDRRAMPRAPVMLRGTMHMDWRDHEIVVLDLSDGGAFVHCLELPPVGANVELKLRATNPLLRVSLSGSVVRLVRAAGPSGAVRGFGLSLDSLNGAALPRDLAAKLRVTLGTTRKRGEPGPGGGG